MIFGSVCSGIGAPEHAWGDLDWSCAFMSEIEAFPRAVLAHHYPGVPMHGDFTTIERGAYPDIDVLVGGTPCQDFSVAGLRAGLAGDRGRLTIEFCHLVGRLRPRWLVWENVPGVLSADGGNAFALFLGTLWELGYGTAYRVLDAQYAGVPQRRRRVFVIGHSGRQWQRAAAVLFERHSLSGDPPPRRKTRQTTPSLTSSGAGVSRVKGAARSDDVEWVESVLNAQADIAQPITGAPYGDRGGGDEAHLVVNDGVAGTLAASGAGSERPAGQCNETDMLVIRNSGRDSDMRDGRAGTTVSDDGVMFTLQAEQQHAIAIAFSCKDNGRDATEDISPTMRSTNEVDGNANGGSTVAVAFQSSQSGMREVETHATLDANNGSRRHNGVYAGSAVRRLTPTECERLQGFPDDFTLVPYRSGHASGCASKRVIPGATLGDESVFSECDCGRPVKLAADGPRYRALGNSMAVPVVRWIGERIELVESLEE